MCICDVQEGDLYINIKTSYYYSRFIIEVDNTRIKTLNSNYSIDSFPKNFFDKNIGCWSDNKRGTMAYIGTTGLEYEDDSIELTQAQLSRKCMKCGQPCGNHFTNDIGQIVNLYCSAPRTLDELDTADKFSSSYDYAQSASSSNKSAKAKKKLSHECPCGIVRSACDYHKE